MEENETYATLHSMLETSRQTKKYFRTNKMQYALFVETFTDIVHRKIPNIAMRKSKLS